MTNSLFEALKNLRFSYRLLLSIYSAILVFVVSPEPRVPLDKARAELTGFIDNVKTDARKVHADRAALWQDEQKVVDARRALEGLGIAATAEDWVLFKAIPETLRGIIDYYSSDSDIVGFVPLNSELTALENDASEPFVSITPVAAGYPEQLAADYRQAWDKAALASSSSGVELERLEGQLQAAEQRFRRASRSFPVELGCDKLGGSAEAHLQDDCAKLVRLRAELTKARRKADDEAAAGASLATALEQARQRLASDRGTGSRPDVPPAQASIGLNGEIKYFVLLKAKGQPRVLIAERVVAQKSLLSKLPPGGVTHENGVSKVLPSVQALEELDQIADRRPQAVLQYLQLRSHSQGRSISLLGFTVHQDVVTVVGGTALLVLLAYFILNAEHILAHTRSPSREVVAEILEFPWVGFFAGRQSQIVVWLSVFVAPLGFLAWMVRAQWFTGGEPEYRWLAAPICVLASIFGWFAARTTDRLRSQLGIGRTRDGDGPAAGPRDSGDPTDDADGESEPTTSGQEVAASKRASEPPSGEAAQ